MIKVGQKFETTMIFGWAEIFHTITSRNGNLCVDHQEWRAEDTGKLCKYDEPMEIKTDENGNEYIVTWKYGDDEGRYYGEE